MIPSLFLLVLAQNAELGPASPTGTNAHFQLGVKTVCELLSSKDFTRAAKVCDRLPRKSVTYRVDWANVPASLKPGFERAVKNTFTFVQDGFKGTSFTPVEKGEDILIEFAEKLPENPDTKIPKGLVVFPSLSVQDPAIEGVIGIKRLSTGVSIEATHVAQETLFLIGQYFGLAEVPGFEGMSSRSDGLLTMPPAIGRFEKVVIQKTLEISDQLREAAKDKKPLMPAYAEAHFDTKELAIGELAQGDIPDKIIGIHNSGTIPMTLSIMPDCSCFRILAPTTIEPGETGNVRILMNTSAFIGEQHKRLYFYTNDPAQPVTVVPVTAFVRPAYRFLLDNGLNRTIYIDENGAKAEVYLTVDDAQDIKAHSASVSGVPGTATIEPWEGELPDLAMNEGPKKRKGYKITVLFAPTQATGVVNATLTVTTNSEAFKYLTFNFLLQHGIAANPKILYFGDIQQAENRAYVLLDQPGRPFKVLKIESTNPHLKGEVEKIAEDQYKLTVTYDGKGLIGALTGDIKVTTDSKESPVVEVPVQGNVK